MKSVIVLVGLVLFGLTLGEVITSDVYACSDKHKNPPDVQHLCKRLTRGQWWNN